MEFKALKHKTMPDTFGAFVDNLGTGEGEIYICSVPYLFPMTAELDDMKAYYAGDKMNWDDYELITIELKLK